MWKFSWYWHRLRAMSPREVALHARKRWRQSADGAHLPDWTSTLLECSGDFPTIPRPESAPERLRVILCRDATRILAGNWKGFGYLDLKVGDPPGWHSDYFAGKDLTTEVSAFKLDHRHLPDGADAKLIWELSRWHPLVRLAMAAHVLGDGRASTKCVEWLEDWSKHNRPYRGWNWTSALEAGMRLIQFTWIDGLLRSAGARDVGEGIPTVEARLESLAAELLPAHIWFVWRHQSFGSSANNHLIGELTGLILATVRWPALERWGAPLAELQRRWEQEVLAQFAEDGGNREQALNYQLFSWELCWQARAALLTGGREISPAVERRLERAARFFWEVQVRREPWDYGDSDSAVAVPLTIDDQLVAAEWREWLAGSAVPGALDYWLGPPPKFRPPLGTGSPENARLLSAWWIFEESGMAISELGFWWLRWDLSPLGYLKTAAHGHLDALHLSIWRNGVAVVIDPGTGAYYADPGLRSWLAGRSAHNTPCPKGEERPRRLGPFLWERTHAKPSWRLDSEGRVVAELVVANHRIRRTVGRSAAGDGWTVEDCVMGGLVGNPQAEFSVRWQFAPGTWVKRLGDRQLRVCRDDISIDLEIGSEWAEVFLVEEKGSNLFRSSAAGGLEAKLAGTVSSAFRRTEWAPFVKLVARSEGGGACVFRTTFLASPRS